MVDADVDATVIVGKNANADLNAKQRAYYAKNKEKVKASNRAWQERNSEYVKQYYKDNANKINIRRSNGPRRERRGFALRPKPRALLGSLHPDGPPIRVGGYCEPRWCPPRLRDRSRRI